MTYEKDRSTASPLEEAPPVSSHCEQLLDQTKDPDPDVRELAWADLFRESGIWKTAEDNCNEDFDS